MTCAVPSFCGYIRCPDANFCREETIWSCFIHCFSFLIIFFNIHGVRTLCYFALERNATVHSRPVTQQLNNSKQTHLESSCPKLSNGICLQTFPRVGGGGGEGFTCWPTDYYYTYSVPARVRHCVNPAKDRQMAPTKSVQGPLWPFSFLIPWA